jgi:hypothetical protein
MRLLAFIAIGASLAGCNLPAQEATAVISSRTNTTPVLTAKSEGKAWSFTASAYCYFVPDDRDYVQPTLTADRGWLHLEARYNYEALDTSSLWIGYNVAVGDKLALEFTPMLGGVFGATAGIAPGYKGTLNWWKLELYTEGEYLFDTDDSSDSFYYTWSEFTLAPVDWFRFGLAVQRTKLYQTDYDIQRGFLVGFTFKRVDLTTYVFNPDASRPMIVLGIGVSF